MRHAIWVGASICVVILTAIQPASAQVRVVPKHSKGGVPEGEPWAEVPDSFKKIKLPEWPLPTDLAQWQNVDRAKTRQTLLQLFGDMPARPDPANVRVIAKEDKGTYWQEKFEFYNGVDMMVPGYLLVPKNRNGRAPAILALHGHGSSKEGVCTDTKTSQCIGPKLAERGYVVAAIDGYFHGERQGLGPGGKLDSKSGGQEETLFKLHLLQGRCLWGMMLREEQCLLDYVATRPEVDPDRIGVTGSSMGCTLSWWLAAIDERVKAVVGVVCFTRYTELIAHGNLRRHGIYYFVPGVLAHFDTEAIYSLVAPRPMLMLSGDEDGGAPTDGVETLEKKLGQVYRLYNEPERFRSVIYKHTGHEYLSEMKSEMFDWFEKYLPVQPVVNK